MTECCRKEKTDPRKKMWEKQRSEWNVKGSGTSYFVVFFDF
jgi:hypothetical protein